MGSHCVNYVAITHMGGNNVECTEIVLHYWYFFIPPPSIELQTSTSVLIKMEAVIMTASTPRAAIPVSVIMGTSCMTTRNARVS